MKYNKAFVNGKIFTADSENNFAEAVVLESDKIVYVGSNQDAYEYMDSDTEIIELDGKVLLPGFIDSHIHLIQGGLHMNRINLGDVKSKDEFKAAIAEFINKNNPEWIVGGGWNNSNWESNEYPDKSWVDDVTGNIPCFLSRLDMHMVLVNTAALEEAGINEFTPDPPGGKIIKNPETMEPTGILKDKAIEMVYNVIPDLDVSDKIAAAEDGMKLLNSLGITSIQDITGFNELGALIKLSNANKLSVRIYSRVPIQQVDQVLDVNLVFPFGSEMLKLGSLKGYTDGSLGSETAWFAHPYVGNDNTGLPSDFVESGVMENWVTLADEHGLQVSLHAIGDEANSYCLRLAKKMEELNPGFDRRFRIEHAQHIKKDEIKLFAETNTIASMQPHHLYDDGEWIEDKIGNERLKYSYPVKSLMDSGAKVCFGSDWPIVTANPLMGIYSAVERQTKNKRYAEGVNPAEKISVTEAVKAYTINAAYASFEENIKGSIEAGKFADFVVLDKDIFEIPHDEIPNVKVLATILGGEQIYGDLK